MANLVDLRAAAWRQTQLVQNSQGVVQHLGDDKFPDGLAGFLGTRLAEALNGIGAKSVAIKTTDIRLSIPDVRLDDVRTSTAVATSGLIALPMVALLSGLSKNKSASAVICINVDGADYLGNDARLFRVGAEAELRASIEAAVTVLARNVTSGTRSNSAACAPGWEGGQPRAS